MKELPEGVIRDLDTAYQQPDILSFRSMDAGGVCLESNSPLDPIG